MNETVVLAVIGVVVAGLILWPLLGRGRPTTPPPRRASGGGAPDAAATEVPDEMSELELDRAMGRISEADYVRWTAPAAADPAAEPPPATSTPASGAADALVQSWRAAPRPRCVTCGERPEPAARYCSNCGATLGA
jgi:hypothetical protein